MGGALGAALLKVALKRTSVPVFSRLRSSGFVD